MKNFFTSGFVVSIGLLMLSSAGIAGSKKVRIFAPTPVEQVEKKPVKKDTDNVQVIIQRVYHVPYYTRGERLKLFVGPRYPGFHKQYRGPKYPF